MITDEDREFIENLNKVSDRTFDHLSKLMEMGGKQNVEVLNLLPEDKRLDYLLESQRMFYGFMGQVTQTAESLLNQIIENNKSKEE